MKMIKAKEIQGRQMEITQRYSAIVSSNEDDNRPRFNICCTDENIQNCHDGKNQLSRLPS